MGLVWFVLGSSRPVTDGRTDVPANMPTYRDGGTFRPLVAAARPLSRSLSSPSSSTEMAMVRITNCSSASPSGVLTSIFTYRQSVSQSVSQRQPQSVSQLLGQLVSQSASQKQSDSQPKTTTVSQSVVVVERERKVHY